MFPQYQDIVFEELKKVFPDVEHFEVEYADLQKLEYLDRVLNETLRIIPPVPTVSRDLIEVIRLSNNVLVPKGVSFVVDIFHIHRNKEYWGPNAETFNPDNFLADNVRGRHPYAFLPFSKGRRNCIGWKYALLLSKIALAKILRNYRISTDFRYEDLVFIDGVITKLRKSPLLRFQRRTSK
ncbi:probable cytochrome P450 313a4 [Drosophila ananassae]|uniref:probable cytochrome P450 313a4 n=1 Tax=Drosophila ananassae TaxID=7217 RepID=UPI001CFFE4EA|nr:probable cytochrome P450 313a4 [Drosophila ananassae]